MKIFLIIITLLISYLIGSIPIGFLIVKRRKNIDIREAENRVYSEDFYIMLGLLMYHELWVKKLALYVEF